jgi:hypothetical protein
MQAVDAVKQGEKVVAGEDVRRAGTCFPRFSATGRHVHAEHLGARKLTSLGMHLIILANLGMLQSTPNSLNKTK